MTYKFLEGLTMADIAFEARGKTIEEMFKSAADAMTSTQMQDISKIEAKIEKKFLIKSADAERLLHDFLQELIFYKDAELLLFKDYKLKAKKLKTGEYELAVTAKGDTLDPKKYTLLVDVKAVSWHKFKVEQTKDGWVAVIIIDV